MHSSMSENIQQKIVKENGNIPLWYICSPMIMPLHACVYKKQLSAELYVAMATYNSKLLSFA